MRSELYWGGRKELPTETEKTHNLIQSSLFLEQRWFSLDLAWILAFMDKVRLGKQSLVFKMPTSSDHQCLIHPAYRIRLRPEKYNMIGLKERGAENHIYKTPAMCRHLTCLPRCNLQHLVRLSDFSSYRRGNEGTGSHSTLRGSRAGIWTLVTILLPSPSSSIFMWVQWNVSLSLSEMLYSSPWCGEDPLQDLGALNWKQMLCS